jgi:hypothetical protein
VLPGGVLFYLWPGRRLRLADEEPGLGLRPPPLGRLPLEEPLLFPPRDGGPLGRRLL